MAILGSTSQPTTSQEGFGLNTDNQMAMLLTMPGTASDSWRIYLVGGWLGGWNDTVTARFAVWTAGGSVMDQSASFTVANEGALAVGATSHYQRSDISVVVAGGTQVYVGYWRHPSNATQNGVTSSGSHLHDASTGTGGAYNFSGFSTHGGKIGFYLYYESANTAPDAPTITEPDADEVVNDTTPQVDWTFNDDDAGDSQTAYQLQLSETSSFTSPLGDTGKVVSVNTFHDISTVLTRGADYYVRVRTYDESDAVSPWSATRRFVIASLPVGTVVSPGSSTAAPLYYVSGSDTTPKFEIDWTFSCAEGGTQTSASVKIYADSAGSPGSLLHTHAHSGSATLAQISGYAPVNGTKYHVSVTPTCSHGAVGTESAKKYCRVRWGRASYRADLTTAPLTLSVAANTTLNFGQAVLEYASSAATTPEPTDWKATIAEVTKQQYVWHRVTLMPQPVASPASPALNDVTFSYSANVLVLDKWTMESQWDVDLGTYVYGTQSLKYTGNGTAKIVRQTMAVTPNTNYVLSVRAKVQGNAGADFKLRDPVSLGDFFVVTLPTVDTDWARYVSPVWNSGSSTSVELVLKGNGAAGTFAWFDAVKLEASTVVTPWTPGFLGSSVVLDAGGVQVDGTTGGIFRLRGSIGGSRDTVELGTKGLLLGGDVELSSPSSGVLAVSSGDYLDVDGVGLRQYRNTAQAITTGTWTKVQLTTGAEWTGIGAAWDGTNFDIEVTRAGVYLIVGKIYWSNNATGQRIVGLSFGSGGATPSATPSNRSRQNAVPVTNINIWNNISNVVQLAANDTVSLCGFQDCGVNLNINEADLTLIRLSG